MEDEEGKPLFHLMQGTWKQTDTIEPCHTRPRGTITAGKRTRLSSHIRFRQTFPI